MIEGNFFITPHAVNRFIKWIAPKMQYEQALAEIIKDLKIGIKSIRPTQNGAAVYIRVCGKWKFRAIVKTGNPRPIVVTILRG